MARYSDALQRAEDVSTGQKSVMSYLGDAGRKDHPWNSGRRCRVLCQVPTIRFLEWLDVTDASRLLW